MAGMLTPGPSTDLSGQKADMRLIGSLDPNFALPPAALSAIEARSSSVSTTTSSESKGSDSSYRPVSPLSPAVAHKSAGASSSSSASPTQSRKRSNTQRSGSGLVEDYALPPPPTRTRKIIQMKPKGQDGQEADKAGKPSSSKTSPGKAAPSVDGSAATAGPKRKPGNGSTAASRKVARKTAHSLIERRRRSKMNEEFGVLKDMIPACSGQEMHKLAILQASIEYMRYLEKCVKDLKTAHTSRGSSVSRSPYSLQPRKQSLGILAVSQSIDDEESDEEMTEATASNPPSTFSVVSPQFLGSAQTSPALTAGSHQFYFRPPLTLPSPAFGPQRSPKQTHKESIAQSPSTALPSPVLLPQADHEATAALMMLGTDRRSWDGKLSERKSVDGARGMSVRDLLTSG